MEQLFSNYILICAVCAWMVCQVFKILLYGFRLHQWNIRYLWAAGGMPSSHSASVVALATAVGLHEGFSSGLFAACAVFAFVVMYDAAGVRRETGKQGQIINEIMRQPGTLPEDSIFGDLKEKVGHSPMEVLAGAAAGVLCAVVFRLLSII